MTTVCHADKPMACYLTDEFTLARGRQDEDWRKGRGGQCVAREQTLPPLDAEKLVRFVKISDRERLISRCIDFYPFLFCDALLLPL